MRDLRMSGEFAITEVAALAVGGASRGATKSPMHSRMVAELLAEVRGGRIEIVSRCATGESLSTISRLDTIRWLRQIGAVLPAALSRPATLAEALDLIEEIRRALAELVSRVDAIEAAARK